MTYPTYPTLHNKAGCHWLKHLQIRQQHYTQLNHTCTYAYVLIFEAASKQELLPGLNVH